MVNVPNKVYSKFEVQKKQLKMRGEDVPTGKTFSALWRTGGRELRLITPDMLPYPFC